MEKTRAKTVTDDPYMPHDGGLCPVKGMTLVDVKTRGAEHSPPREYKKARAHHWVWEHRGNDRDIVGYRLSMTAEEVKKIFSKAERSAKMAKPVDEMMEEIGSVTAPGLMSKSDAVDWLEQLRDLIQASVEALKDEIANEE